MTSLPGAALLVAEMVGLLLAVTFGVALLQRRLGDALHAKGAGTGSIVALVIAGAGANIPEFALLTKVARGRVVAAFFAYVFVVAVAAGLLTDLIL